jgi:transcriptional regulator with XRE-family HTH domain
MLTRAEHGVDEMARRSAAAIDSSPVPNTRLKTAMFDYGRQQYAIADAVGMSPYRLSRIVRGRQDPTPDEQDRLAEFLKRSRRHLFTRGGRDDD